MPFFPHNTEPDIQRWEEMLQRWLQSMKRRRGSLRTFEEYQRNLRHFFNFLEGKHPALVVGADCERYCAWMEEQGLAQTTMNARLAAVSSFYRFAGRYEVEPGRYLHPFNPAMAVQRFHIRPYQNAKGLAIAQVRALLASCDRSTLLGARDYALLLFYLFTARRKTEIPRMQWRDIRDGQEPGIKEYRYVGKGGKGGWRVLPRPVWEAIQEYLILAGRLEMMKEDSPIFLPTNDNTLHRDNAARTEGRAEKELGNRTISQIIERAARRAGLEDVTVHTLRYTAAQLRRKSGDSVDAISDFLDHSNSGITKLYLAAMESKEDTSWQKVASLLEQGDM